MRMLKKKSLPPTVLFWDSL